MRALGVKKYEVRLAHTNKLSMYPMPDLTLRFHRLLKLGFAHVQVFVNVCQVKEWRSHFSFQPRANTHADCLTVCIQGCLQRPCYEMARSCIILVLVLLVRFCHHRHFLGQNAGTTYK